MMSKKIGSFFFKYYFVVGTELIDMTFDLLFVMELIQLFEMFFHVLWDKNVLKRIFS